jgi:tRNA-specific 2-thiouridylase
LKLDFKNNALIVTDNEKDLYKKELVAEKVNWVSGGQAKMPLEIKAKIRYSHPARSATITKKLKPKTYKLVFSRPQRAITPGQSVVFYRGQEVLGGGVIK